MRKNNLPMMTRSLIAALALCLPGIALAAPQISSGTSQFGQATHAANVPTRFEPMSNSLEELLNLGYEIRSSASGEGSSVLILVKPGTPATPTRWVRCELLGDHNANTMLRLSSKVTSACRALN